MKKIVSALVLCGFCVSAMTAALEPVSAAAYETVQSYTFCLQPERTYVSAEELAQGDVHIRTHVYIQGDPTQNMRSFTVSYAADTDYIYFDNSMDILDWQDDTTYTYSGGTFTTDYYPFSFGKLSSKGKYSQDGTTTIAKYLFEPMSGEVIYSDGNGGIYFIRSYNKIDPDTGEQVWISGERVEIPADQITVLPNGHATFTYSYYYQDGNLGFPLRENTFEMPYYDPTLPADTEIKGENDVCLWLASVGSTDGAAFFGYTDEFPCFSFDIVLRQGTPNGTYNVTLDEDMCRLRGSDRTLLPLKYRNTTITIGDTAATVTEDKTSPYYCFFAESAQEVRLNRNSGAVTDAAASEAVVTCGQSPADLYATQNSGVYIGNVPFYEQAEQMLHNADGSPYTKTFLIGKKGDANLDGTVDVEDAMAVLQYYANQSAGNAASLGDAMTEEEQTLSYFLADIDTCSQNCGTDGGMLRVEDAVQILTYYAQTAAGLQPEWSSESK